MYNTREGWQKRERKEEERQGYRSARSSSTALSEAPLPGLQVAEAVSSSCAEGTVVLSVYGCHWMLLMIDSSHHLRMLPTPWILMGTMLAATAMMGVLMFRSTKQAQVNANLRTAAQMRLEVDGPTCWDNSPPPLSMPLCSLSHVGRFQPTFAALSPFPSCCCPSASSPSLCPRSFLTIPSCLLFSITVPSFFLRPTPSPLRLPPPEMARKCSGAFSVW